MEFILVHKPIGAASPEVTKMEIANGKAMVANPQQLVPNGKLISMYFAITKCVFCIWDVPKFEDLIPVVRTMSLANWDTEVIPVQKAEVALPELEKALTEMQAMQAQQ